MPYFGVCSKCSKYSIAPSAFKETKHFLVCGDCGADMYLDRDNPEKAAYKRCEKLATYRNHGVNLGKEK